LFSIANNWSLKDARLKLLTAVHHHPYLAFWGAGIAAGIALALFGAGGGLFFVPVLHLLFKMPLRATAATSLAAIFFTAIAGLAGHLQVMESDFPLKATVFLIIASSFSVQIAVLLRSKMPLWLIEWLYILFLLAVALRVLFISLSDPVLPSQPPALWAVLLIGILSGCLSGTLGIGGGIVVVGGMVGLFGQPLVIAVGMSMLSILATSFSGTLSFHFQGEVRWASVWPLAIPSILAAPLGSYLAHVLHPMLANMLFALFLLGMAWQFFSNQRKRKGGTDAPGLDKPIQTTSGA
jgi:hypothetical protein